MRKRTLSRSIEPVDEWLESLGYFRKQVPRDHTCLYRAVAELVCLSQSYHDSVKSLTLDYMLLYKSFFQEIISEPLENYVRRKRNPLEGGGDIELKALSLLFKVDFLVFNEIGIPAISYGFSFSKKLMLYKDPSNYYDIVYMKSLTFVAGFCQSLVYEILYLKVFKMDDVRNVVDQMLHDNGTTFRKDSVNSEGQEMDIFRIVEQVTDPELSKTSGVQFDVSMECFSTPEKGLTPPFPYRVAKALDPNVYRNSDYDTWIAIKREARFGPYDSKGLQIGVKVIIRLNNTKDSPPNDTSKDIIKLDRVFHGHIQSMTENQGPVEVFVEELGKRITVPYHCLEKVQATPTRSSLQDVSFFMNSPPSYKMLSTLTRKSSALPVPEYYSSPGHGRNKKFFSSSLPSAIHASKKAPNTKWEMKKEAPSITSPEPEIAKSRRTNSCSKEPYSTDVQQPSATGESEESSPLYSENGSSCPNINCITDMIDKSIKMNDRDLSPAPFPTGFSMPNNFHPPMPFSVPAIPCSEVGCNGNCGSNIMIPYSYPEPYGFPSENHYMMNYFVPCVPQPYLPPDAGPRVQEIPHTMTNLSPLIPVYPARMVEGNQQVSPPAFPIQVAYPVYPPPPSVPLPIAGGFEQHDHHWYSQENSKEVQTP